MGGYGNEMHKCGHREAQEKCPAYLPKNETPGKVNLTCIWYRKDYLGKEVNNGGSICTKSLQKDATGVHIEGS